MSEFDDSPVTDDFSTANGMLFPESRSQALDMIVNMFLENNTIEHSATQEKSRIK